jgi:hypothetical protein
MATDPRIALATRANIGNTFQNALLNVQGAENLFERREQQPLRNRLLEAQVGGAEAGVQQQEQLNRFQSVAFGAAEILPNLKSGNFEGVQQQLEARRSQLIQQGRDTTETDNALNTLRTNPQALLTQVNEVMSVAQQQGILKAPTAFQQTKFIGTPSRTTKDGQNFLTGLVRQPNGTFKTVSVPVAGEFVSILGETAAGEVETEVDKQTRLAALELKTKPKIEAAVVTAKGAAEAETEIGATELAVKRLARDETKIKNDQDRLELIGAKEASIAESNNAISRINGLLTGDRFSAGFGKLVANTPEALRSQEAIDVIAELDQIRGLVSLESRQKLKGQGTISDSEAKTLERSATVLSNPLISDKLARKELKIIKTVFERSTARNQLAKSTREQRLVKQPAEGAAELTEGVIIVNPTTGERMQVVNNELVVIP